MRFFMHALVLPCAPSCVAPSTASTQGLAYSPSMRTFDTLADLAACVGQHVAATDWVEITQQQVNQFAEATGDHQWIHVDVERAKKGPFGAPIAHGFLTLSLIPAFSEPAIKYTSVKMGVNYGLNKVRFTNPVKVNSRVRGRFVLKAFEEIEGGAQITMGVTVEIEGQEKPACVAESISRRFE